MYLLKKERKSYIKRKENIYRIGIIEKGFGRNRPIKTVSNSDIPPNSLLCVSDEFGDKYINFNREASGTTFGAETYYGQDFIWKNEQGNILIFDLP